MSVESFGCWVTIGALQALNVKDVFPNNKLIFGSIVLSYPHSFLSSYEVVHRSGNGSAVVRLNLEVVI